MNMIRFAAVAVALAVFCPAPTAAQAQPVSGGPVDPSAINDLVIANHILFNEGVVDGLGHISIRHPTAPNRFLLARSIAPGSVTAADIIEYDLDSVPVDANGRGSYSERFIHGEIYKLRPDVNSVVHSHSPAVIPFGVTKVPMQAVFHSARHLAYGVPVFEIRDFGGMTDMLVRNTPLGKALAQTLADKTVVLMRGHGNAVVGPNVKVAVQRAILTEINARLQTTALTLGGPITYLDPEEARLLDASDSNGQGTERQWALWKAKVEARK